MFRQVIIFAGCLCFSFGQDFVPIEIQRHFEFENALTAEQKGNWVWRSQASGLKNLRLEDGNRTYSVRFTLCLEPFNVSQNISVKVDDIRYSNDGPSDTIFLTLDSKYLGQFNTTEKWRSGHEWNVFRNSGQIGELVTLTQGPHVLEISVVTDTWGVELDRIRINAENQDPDRPLFCGAYLI